MTPRAYLRDSVAASAAIDAFLVELERLDGVEVRKRDALDIADRLEARLVDVRFWVARLEAGTPDDARLAEQRDGLMTSLEPVVAAMEATQDAAENGNATALVTSVRNLRTAMTTLRTAAATAG